MTRGLILRRVLVLSLPVGALVGAAHVPGHFPTPALATTIYVPPDTTIPDTTIPECVVVWVSTTEPPPTSVRVCPWP